MAARLQRRQQLLELANALEVVVDQLGGLPDAPREVLELAYFHGLSSSEIAEALGIPLGTVKSRTAAGLRALRAGLEALGGEP